MGRNLLPGDVIQGRRGAVGDLAQNERAFLRQPAFRAARGRIVDRMAEDLAVGRHRVLAVADRRTLGDIGFEAGDFHLGHGQIPQQRDADQDAFDEIQVVIGGMNVEGRAQFQQGRGCADAQRREFHEIGEVIGQVLGALQHAAGRAEEPENGADGAQRVFAHGEQTDFGCDFRIAGSGRQAHPERLGDIVVHPPAVVRQLGGGQRQIFAKPGCDQPLRFGETQDRGRDPTTDFR